MSYLVVLAGLLGFSLYFDLSVPLAGGIILTGVTVWFVLLNHKMTIPKW